MLACSPKGTVPVLQLPDGRVIDESLDIIIWALQRNDPEHWLPRTASGQTRAMELIATNDGDFKHHLDRYKYANRYPGVESVTHRIEAEKFLARLEEELVVGSFLAGARPGLADFAIGPFIRQFANADRAWFDETSYPQLHTWLDWFLGSDPFMAVMKKYPQWFQTKCRSYFHDVFKPAQPLDRRQTLATQPSTPPEVSELKGNAPPNLDDGRHGSRPVPLCSPCGFRDSQRASSNCEAESVVGTLILQRRNQRYHLWTRLGIHKVLAHLRRDPRLVSLVHMSLVRRCPRLGIKVRLKKEIVTMGVPRLIQQNRRHVCACDGMERFNL